MKLALSEDRGLTLIEILIATVLLAVIALSVLAAYGGSMTVSTSDLRRTAAINIARDRIEAIKAFEGLNSEDAVWTANLNNLPPDRTINGIDYQIVTSFLTPAEVPALAPHINDVRAVRITVIWEYQEAPQQVSYITYYRR